VDAAQQQRLGQRRRARLGQRGHVQRRVALAVALVGRVAGAQQQTHQLRRRELTHRVALRHGRVARARDVEKSKALKTRSYELFVILQKAYLVFCWQNSELVTKMNDLCLASGKKAGFFLKKPHGRGLISQQRQTLSSRFSILLDKIFLNLVSHFLFRQDIIPQ
jgi:hypothetical protein